MNVLKRLYTAQNPKGQQDWDKWKTYYIYDAEGKEWEVYSKTPEGAVKWAASQDPGLRGVVEVTTNTEAARTKFRISKNGKKVKRVKAD